MTTATLFRVLNVSRVRLLSCCSVHVQSFTMTLGSERARAGTSDSNGAGTEARLWSAAASNPSAQFQSATDISTCSSTAVSTDPLQRDHVSSIGFTSAAEAEQQGRWRFCLLQPKAGFTAALCVEQAAGALHQADSYWQAPLLRMWQTVPLLQEYLVSSKGCLLATS
jgi:hypothetical protein